MGKNTPITGVKSGDFPKLKENISGKKAWEFLHVHVGNIIFGGHTYFGIIAPKSVPEHTTSSLRGKLLGRLKTWADSAFDQKRAEAVKDILDDIVNSEMNRVRDNFIEHADELMAETQE